MKHGARRQPDLDMLAEYDFSSGTQGKYAERYAAGTNVVVLAPDVSPFFPDSDSVNDALRMLIRIAQEKTKRASG